MMQLSRLVILAMGLLIWIHCQSALAMTFEKQERCISAAKPNCQPVILAVGQIDKQTSDQFKSVAKDFPQGTWVVLSSPGGSVVNALRLGQQIREAGFNTTIGSTDYSPPNCLSSCAYAFAGGISRHLPAGSKYGIHQFRGIDKALNEDESQKISATLGAYLDVMGVDRHLLDYAQVTTSDKVNVLTLAQAKLLRVDNTGQSPYPRWRLEASATGQLIAVNNPPPVNGKPTVVLALITQASTNKNINPKKIVLILFHKSDDELLFNQEIDHQILLNQKAYDLKQIDSWQRKTNGYQANFSIDENTLNALQNAPEESTLILKSNLSNTRFGVGGFKNVYQALIGVDTKGSGK